MDYRRLGHSGLRVPAISFGTGTFGGGNDFFRAWGSTDATGATRLIDCCIDHGVTMFDSADVYSDGLAETILGEAIRGKRDRILISTKANLPNGAGPNDYGSSRHHLIRAVDGALRRLRVDHIDLFQLHAQDSNAPVEETLATLDSLVRAGKIRYVGASNFMGWHLMKSLAASDRHGFPRHVGHQVHYSLLCRDYEWELMPLGQDQGVGAIVWSPLSWGRLSGKFRRGVACDPGTRIHATGGGGLPHDPERLFRIVDVLEAIALEAGRSIPQIALNWLSHKPTVSSVIIGARDEAQLIDNIGAVGWRLSDDQQARLDAVSAAPAAYPAWHQQNFPMLQQGAT